MSSGACQPAQAQCAQQQSTKRDREGEKKCETKRKYFNCYEFSRFPIGHFFFFASSASTLFDSFSALALFLLLVPWRCRDKLMVYRHFTLRCKYRIENGYYCIAIHNLWRIFHAHGQMPGDNFRYFSLCCCCVCVVLGLWKIADAAGVKIQP